MVVATGGGTFADPDNRAAINAGRRVGLARRAARRDLIPRIPLDGRRPLAADRAQIERLYRARRMAYQLAHVRRRRRNGPAGRAGRADPRMAGDLGRSTDALSRPHATFTPTSRRSTRCSPLRAGGYDAMLVLGDLVGYGADPNAVIERMLALDAAGDHPRQSRQGRVRPRAADGFNDVARAGASSGRCETLTAEHRAWLAQLPKGPIVDRRARGDLPRRAVRRGRTTSSTSRDAVRALDAASAAALPVRPHALPASSLATPTRLDGGSCPTATTCRCRSNRRRGS